MKNMINALAIIAFVLFAFTSSAQDAGFYSKLNQTDSVGAKEFANKLISSTGKDLKLNYKKQKDGLLIFAYNSAVDENDGVIITFYQSDKQIYSLKSVYGKFSDLLPFWKDHVSNKLTTDQLSKSGEIYSLSGSKKIRFRQYQDLIWSIDLI